MAQRDTLPSTIAACMQSRTPTGPSTSYYIQPFRAVMGAARPWRRRTLSRPHPYPFARCIRSTPPPPPILVCEGCPSVLRPDPTLRIRRRSDVQRRLLGPRAVPFPPPAPAPGGGHAPVLLRVQRTGRTLLRHTPGLCAPFRVESRPLCTFPAAVPSPPPRPTPGANKSTCSTWCRDASCVLPEVS